jgi:TolB-like protein
VKNIILIILFAFTSCFGFSQKIEDARMKVGVAGFENSDPKDKKYISLITERVLTAIQKTNRFLVIDLTNTAAREKAAAESAKNWNADWSESIDVAKGLSAAYIVTGNVGDIKFVKITSSNPNGYKAIVSVTIKLMKTESGSIISTETFEVSSAIQKLTPEAGLSNALDQLEPLLVSYVKDNFPLKLKIARIEEQKKGKAKKVIISAGSLIGIEKGNVFMVYEIDRSLGSPLPKEIGKIKVEEVLNDKFSTCSVSKGGELILPLFNDKKEIECVLTKE